MKLIQIGMGKSGNFWFYQILQQILKAKNIESKSFIQNHPIHPVAKDWKLSFQGQADIDFMTIEPKQVYWRISQIVRMPIDDLDDHISKTSHVWAHSFHCQKTPEVLSKFDKIIYIIRDPRDAALSMSRYAFTPYQKKFFNTAESNPEDFLSKKLIDMMNQWVRHVGDYLKHIQEYEFYVVFYERFLADFKGEMSKLCRYLGLSLDEHEIDRIQTVVSVENLKQQNPQHVNKGQSGQWKNRFSPRQKKMALKMAGPLLKLLNYPLRDEDNGLPCLPQPLHTAKIDQIMTSTKRRFFVGRVTRFMNKRWKFL